ncbi:DUF5654 family protein [Nanoarchaeota archaeon]
MRKKTKLKKRFVKRTAMLLIAGFSLVAALAWNNAIQALFDTYLGEINQIWAKFIYAVFITLIAAIIVANVEKFQE